MNFDTSILEKYDTMIFDFDGTLIDSEPCNKLAHCKVLSHLLNKEIVLTDEEYEKYIGKTDIEIYEMFKKHFDIDFDVRIMADKQAEIARDLLFDDKLQIHKYFLELIKEKKDKHFYIVSNHHEKGLVPVLEKKKVISYFDDVFCLSKMNIKKEYFYSNIKKYIPEAKNVIVFEDNVNVLNFLTDIGYSVIAIQTKFNSDFVEGKFKNTINV